MTPTESINELYGRSLYDRVLIGRLEGQVAELQRQLTSAWAENDQLQRNVLVLRATVRELQTAIHLTSGEGRI